MVDVLDSLSPEAKEQIEYKEWSIKNAEGIQMFQARKGRVLPTLCINEALCYESVIPTIDELYETLIEAAKSEEQKQILRDAYDDFMEEYNK
ncbi:MAG: hypothetical protein Kow00129_08570 [Thermoleophilia bacterium]